MASLAPPSEEPEDTGTRDIHSDSDHFSDASEGRHSGDIPTTRVEKVDAKPSHGEVPGTKAHALRTEDAQPDEVAIVPEASEDNTNQASIPTTVVEKVDPSTPSHGEVPGTAAHDLRKADAEPDVVLEALDVAKNPLQGVNDGEEQVEDEFGEGDDFDDFAEGGEDLGDDDFGAFDDYDEGDDEQTGSQPAVSSVMATEPTQFNNEYLLPLDLDDLKTYDDISQALQTHMEAILPRNTRRWRPDLETMPDLNPSFLTERSQSLWAQLVEPPPLQPPNWVKSRIRRLFLVSLGVPVDLDEILPASKQKKLVLPSLEESSENRNIDGHGGSDGKARAQSDKNADKTAGGSSEGKANSRRRGPPPPPEFDVNTARLLCLTTPAALENLSVRELKEHNARLADMKHRANSVLQYWLLQKDSATGDKEAFEEVIENLVKHAKRIRN